MMTGSAVHLSESCCKPAIIIANFRVSPAERVSLRPASAVHAFHQETKSATAFDMVAISGIVKNTGHRICGTRNAKITIKKMFRFSTVWLGNVSVIKN